MTTKRALIALAIVTVLAIVAGIVLGIEPSEPDFEAASTWPERLSWSAETKIVVQTTTFEPTARPVPGAHIALFQLEGSGWNIADHIVEKTRLKPITDGVTDASGLAVITIPPLAEAGEGPLSPTGSGEVHLVLKAEHQGEVEWYHRRFTLPHQSAVALTTDRPLYQPGQKVLMRVVAVDPDIGVPVDRSVDWQVRDPRGNLVFEKTAPTGRSGVSSTSFSLAPECLQGSYSIRISAGDASATKNFDVRPFRLPRFKVAVNTDKTVATSADLVGTVSANYTYGDAVVGAEVNLSIQYVRTGGVQAVEPITGKLDEKGQLPFTFRVPADADAGRGLTLAAIVTSEAGRAEQGSARVSISAPVVQVRIRPRVGASFVNSRKNLGLVRVTSAVGSPMEGVKLSITVPEQKEERTMDVTSDKDGLAEFSWTPSWQRQPIRVVATLQGAPPQRFSISPTVASEIAVQPATPVAYVGQPLQVRLTYAGQRSTIIAFHEERPVAVAAASTGQGDTSLGTITLGSDARGLTSLAVVDDYGSIRGSHPVWVVDEGGHELTMTTDAETYRPGQPAKLTLGFPPGIEAPKDKPPVYFGVIGVDEALYALAERTDQPLQIVLRHGPGTQQRAAAAVSATKGIDFDKASPLLTDWVRGEFADGSRDTSLTSYSRFRASDHTSAVLERERRPFVDGFLLAMVALGLLVLFVGARATFIAMSREAWSWKALGIYVGVVVLTLAAVIGMGSVSEEYLSGGLTVWMVIVLIWLITAAVKLRDELPMGHWLISIVIFIAVVIAASLTQMDGPQPSEWVAVVLAIAGILPAILLLVEFFVWAFILRRAEHNKPAYGLITIFGLLGGAVLVSTLGTLSMGGDMAMEQMAAPSAARVTGAALKKDAEMPMAVEEEMAVDQDGAAPGKSREGRADGKPGAATPRVRSWFPETMVWLPSAPSDEEGKLTTTLELPDSITTWRLTATAHTWDGRFGEGEKGLVVIQPYFVELDLPTHLTSGDRIEVPVTVVNNTGAPLRTELTFTGEGLTVARPPKGVEVPANDRTVLFIEVIAGLPGRSTMEVKALGYALDAEKDAEPVQSDAVRRPAQVRPDGRELALSTSGIIGKGWSGTIEVPKYLPGSADASLDVFPGVVADAQKGLSSMLRRPMGCFEQTSSANYPNIMIARALKDTRPESWPDGAKKWAEDAEKAQEVLSLGYQRMLTFQQSDGGFALYPDKDSQILLTAYGIIQLSAMKEVRSVDDGVISRAASWLVSQQNASGTWPAYKGGVDSNTDPAQLRSTAFVAWALLVAPNASSYKQATDKALAHLARKHGEADSADALALTVTALAVGNNSTAAKEAAKSLVASARRDGGKAYWTTTRPTWMGGLDRYANIETTAMAAYALLEAGAEGEIGTAALRYLAEMRSPWGGWGTTQATVWALRAFERLRQLSAKGEVTLTARVDDAAMTLVSGGVDTGDGTTTLKPGGQLLRSFTSDTVQAGPMSFSIATTGTTSAMVSARVMLAVPWDSPAAEVQGERFRVETNLEERTLLRGQPVRFAVTVDNPTDRDYAASIVEMPLPVGSLADEDDLKKLVEGGVIDHFEVLPTHVRLYLANFPRNARKVYGYRVIPLVRGSMSLPPTRAYVFYAPDPVTEADAGELIVR